LASSSLHCRFAVLAVLDSQTISGVPSRLTF
jgi:hypothetical protein